MAFDAALLRQSFQILHAREPHIPRRFYEVFFKLHPTVAPLFHRRGTQEVMFAKALVAIIDRVDDAPWLDEQLRELGQRHVDVPIQPEMWDWFQHALMTTLEEIAADAWTPEVEATWNAALSDILAKIRKGRDAGPVTGAASS